MKLEGPFKYGLLKRPSNSSGMVYKLLNDQNDTKSNDIKTTIDLEGNWRYDEAIMPIEEVAGLTVGDLCYYPFFLPGEESEYRNPNAKYYLYFVMYDSLTFDSFKSPKVVRYIYAIDWRKHQDEPIEKVITDHLRERYRSLNNETNKYRAAFFIHECTAGYGYQYIKIQEDNRHSDRIPKEES